jgi:uncharacterized protein YPO0396
MKKFMKKSKKKDNLKARKSPLSSKEYDSGTAEPNNTQSSRGLNVNSEANASDLEAETRDVGNSFNENVTSPKTSVLKNPITHFGEKLRNQKASQKQITNDERIQELRDQNQYLIEKVQFLKLQKMRNESEIIRLDSKQKELKVIHNTYITQLDNVSAVFDDWKKFQGNLTKTAVDWGEQSKKFATAPNVCVPQGEVV